jgi:hypothetical protein
MGLKLELKWRSCLGFRRDRIPCNQIVLSVVSAAPVFHKISPKKKELWVGGSLIVNRVSLLVTKERKRKKPRLK